MNQIDRKIIAIALPAIAGFMGHVLFDLTDIFWIGQISPKAVAGAASAGFLLWTFFAAMQITVSGCASLTARFYGAGNIPQAQQIVAESTRISLALGIISAAILLPYAEWPFRLMGLDPESTSHALAYFKVMLAGLPIIYLNFLSENVFNAYGDTRTSTIIMIASLGLNMLLDPVLIFGFAGVPDLGIAGAALATIIAQTVSLVARTIVAFRKGYIGGLSSFTSMSFKNMAQVFSIGLPNAMTGVLWSAVYPLLTRIITPYGMAPLSALGICHRIESFPYHFAMGFNIAMISLIGQAKGRSDDSQINLLAKRGVFLSSLFTVPFILLFLVAGPNLMAFLTDDPSTIEHGARYLFIIGLFGIFMSWELTYGGVFTGMGKTGPTLLISVPFTLGRIPLGWFLAEQIGMGVDGVWWAISISTLAKGIGLAILFKFQETPVEEYGSVVPLPVEPPRQPAA